MSDSLKGLASWLTRPALVVGAGSGALGIAYGAISIALPPGSRLTFLGISLCVCAMMLGRVFWRDRRATAVLREVGTGRLPPTREHLTAALLEARATPDRTFLFVVGMWILGAVMIAGFFAAFEKVPWSTVGRIVWVGFLFGPMAATLAHLLVLVRSRVAIERIAAAGLSVGEVIAALPPERAQLRRRLMIFISVAVLTPAALVADLSIHKTDAAFDAVLAADLSAQATVAATGMRDDLAAVGGLAAVVIALSLLVTVLSARALAGPMRRMAEAAAHVSVGEVHEVKLIASEDEVWAAAAAFSAMQAQLSAVLFELQRAGTQLSVGTSQLVGTAGANESGASEQAAALNETSATTEELARSARQIAENAASVAEIAQQTYSAAQAGQKSSELFLQSMARMREENQAIADSVVKLNKRVQQIGKIVEFINEIADKSDLLALNAELEGDKAGDVGRGFSLVAAEMRRLAENVLSSTREIERLIAEVRDATNAAVMATEAGVKATDAGALLASTVSNNLQQILEHARQTSDAVRAISLATQQQQTGTDQLASAMADILRVTEQSAAATRQMADANQDLSTLSLELSKAVERFKVVA